MPKKVKKRAKPLPKTTKKGPKQVKKKENPLKGFKEIVPPMPIIIKHTINQNGKLIVEHPTVPDIMSPKACYSVDETGVFKEQKTPSDTMDIPMYWQSHRKKVAAVMLLSSLFLFMSFASLADPYINFIFNSTMGFIWWGIGSIISLFFGWV